jgi:hypothetical protein
MSAAIKRQRKYKRGPRLSAGGVEMPRLDRRTVSSRRYYALVEQFSDELGGGNLSAMDAGLIRQAAAITLRASSCRRKS